MVTIKRIGTGETIGSSEKKTQTSTPQLNSAPGQGVTIKRIGTGEVLGTSQQREPEGVSLPTLESVSPAPQRGGVVDVLRRIGQGITSGATRRAANTSEKLGTVMELHGGTAMRGVYEDQVETLDRQIEALERIIKDPTSDARDISDAREALEQAQAQRNIYANAVRSNENTAQGIRETVDAANRFAQEQAEKSVEGTTGIGRTALSLVPAATEIAMDVGLNKFLPLGNRFGLGYLARAASEGGASETEYRLNAGDNYDAQKAAQRGLIASGGVLAGSAASAAVNDGALKLLKNKGLQNYVIPNVLKGGLNATAFAGGDITMRELARASTDDYTPDQKQINNELLTAFAFGVVTEFISTAAITGQNKAYMRQLNENLEKGYEYTKGIMQDPRATVEQRATGANSVMQMADELDNALNNMQVVGAQKEVNAIRDFLNSVRSEMTNYLADATAQSTGNIGGVAGGLANAAPPTAPANAQQPTQPTAPVQPAPPAQAPSPANVAGMAATTPVEPETVSEAVMRQLTGQGDESTAVNTDATGHTSAQQQIVNEFVASKNQELRDLFDRVKENGGKVFERKDLAPVSERQATDAARLLGGNYEGYKNAINSNGAQHIISEHGPEGTVDQSLANLDDAARLEYVLENYDSVQPVTYASGELDTSAEFRDANNRPAPMLKYAKKVDGTYYVVEAIPDSKYKKFWVVSAYMEGADPVTQAPDAQSSRNTSETSLASPVSAPNIGMVSQQEQSVKPAESVGTEIKFHFRLT